MRRVWLLGSPGKSLSYSGEMMGFIPPDGLTLTVAKKYHVLLPSFRDIL